MPGDIIKKINGINVKTLDGLITVLRQKRAGDSVEIEILRNSQVITLVFDLDLRPSDV
jgi:S1-C subfamily serine protease